MESLKRVNNNDPRARAIPAMTTEILQRIEKFSANKQAGGPQALKEAVSFSFLDDKSISLAAKLFRRRDTKEGNVAWRVGALQTLPAATLFIDANGQGYVATSYKAPRHADEVTLITKEGLGGMTYEQLEEIRGLLRRSRG